MLCLALRLRMECGGLVAVDVAKFEEARCESGRELGTSVRDNVIRETVMFEYMLQVQAGGFFSVDLGCSGTKVRHLGQSVHTEQDCVATARSREFYDEVH